jgi:drug/metabolite transporter (DMT)-like permease
MTVLGYALFGQTPDRVTLVGTLVVVASGLYVFHRERVVRFGQH